MVEVIGHQAVTFAVNAFLSQFRHSLLKCIILHLQFAKIVVLEIDLLLQVLIRVLQVVHPPLQLLLRFLPLTAAVFQARNVGVKLLILGLNVFEGFPEAVNLVNHINPILLECALINL